MRWIALLTNVFTSLGTNTYFRTLLTGGSGALVSILITYLCVEYLFGKDGYFIAYLTGVAFGVVYAFAVFAIAVFKTTEKLLSRFVFFSAYMALLVIVQASIVRVVVPIVGIDHYLAVITVIIALLSVLNYFVYSRLIFKRS
jgi:putative flippase GtrA